ncbi:MAG: hypothetical protein KBB37_07995 [Bacteroidia bacterium]|jgi:sulfur transfer complex TusBCD TusB component (DsrH family)|nr:hypothetical protein [Bacteroidia bacterium]
MRKLALVSTLLFCTFLVNAQIKALTENGEEVVLYSDGTWKALEKSDLENSVDTNTKQAFVKPTDAAFQLKSQKTNISININTKLWSFKKATSNEDAEYDFQSKSKEMYAMLITEKIEIPIKNLRKIALSNARSVAPDVQIIKEEMRKVNGQYYLCMQMNGTIEGIKFTYYGYYFSSSKGTVQFISYTAQNLFESYKSDMESLLNGMSVLD